MVIAAERKGPAADALERFGLTARQLTSMGTEAAFTKIVQALEQVHNPAERAKDAVDLFGKSGQGMINMVARGSDELKGLGDDASRLGIALNAIDAAKVEEADQAFIKLSAAASGFANLVVTQLSPFIVKAIDEYIEWGYQGTKSASFVAQGMGWVVTSTGLVVDAVNSLKGAWYGLQGFVTGAITGWIQLLGKFVDACDALLSKLGVVHTGWKELSDSLKVTADVMGDKAKDLFDKSAKAFDKVGSGAETTRKLIDDIQRGAA